MTILSAHIPEAGYGKKVILRNIYCEVYEKAIVAFIGPNGAGKSTLLKALMGIVPTPKGRVVFQEKEISSIAVEQRVQSGIAFVPQGNRIFTELTVRENLEIGAYLLKDRAEVSHRIDTILEIFPDLKYRLSQDAGVLSGGEKQELAVARAMMLDPKILLLDEPSLGLSTKNVIKAFTLIDDISKKKGTTILIVEQKVREVLKIANHVYALKMGEIVFNGLPSELQKDLQLKSVFLS